MYLISWDQAKNELMSWIKISYAAWQSLNFKISETVDQSLRPIQLKWYPVTMVFLQSSLIQMSLMAQHTLANDEPSLNCLGIPRFCGFFTSCNDDYYYLHDLCFLLSLYLFVKCVIFRHVTLNLRQALGANSLFIGPVFTPTATTAIKLRYYCYSMLLHW
jgi:hypothetical protein